MKKQLFLLLCSLSLASCEKRDEAQAKNDKGRSMEDSKSISKKNLTVDAAKLKGIARTRYDSPNPTESQLSRRQKNIRSLKEMGVPVLDDLPVVEDEKAAKFRSPEEIAKRCLATTFCAVKGETTDKMLVDSLVKDYAASTYFSPKEQRFLEALSPPRQDLIDFAWRYECVHVFLWAMGARDELGKPNAICPVAEDMKLIKQLGPAKFVAQAKRRPLSEILDAADLYYRLHWAAIELRIRGVNSNRLDEGVIRERHRALNWLIGYLNQEWDDVTTDT